MKAKKNQRTKATKTKVEQLNRETITAIATSVARAELNEASLNAKQFKEIVHIVETVSSTEIAKHTNGLALPSELPSPETIAMIAATLTKGGIEQPAIAVDHAVKLYDAACAKLDYAMKYRAAKEREAEKMASIPRPKQFPATLDDFLRLIVPGKTLKEREERFRDYYRHQVKSIATMGHPEKYPGWLEWAEKQTFSEMTPEERRDPKWKGKTDKQIGAAKQQEIFDNRVESLMEENKHGFSNETSWLGMAKAYNHWWDHQISEKARAASAAVKDRGGLEKKKGGKL